LRSGWIASNTKHGVRGSTSSISTPPEKHRRVPGVSPSRSSPRTVRFSPMAPGPTAYPSLRIWVITSSSISEMARVGLMCLACARPSPWIPSGVT
jgi:hypothetical protein